MSKIDSVAPVAVVAPVKAGRGRPAKFVKKSVIAALKSVVKKHGLLAGHEQIVANGGVTVRGKLEPLTVSLPTLSKYVKSGENSVELKRGRPRKAA